MNTSEILTSEEMAALLPDNGKTGQTAVERDKRGRIVPYNFRRPDRLSKEQVRSLYLLHDLFAHQLSSSLPLFLRAVSEVNLISVEQQSYQEYLRQMQDPSIVYTLAMQPLSGYAALEISPAIAFPTIDRMLGGAGSQPPENRPATEIEQKILEGFLTQIVNSLTEAWKPVIEFDVQVAGCETRPQLLQIVAPNEVVVVIGLYVQIGDTKGTMSICLPVVLLEPVIERFVQSSYARMREAQPEQTAGLLNSVQAVRFKVHAELEPFRAVVSELLDLSKGDVLRTNHRLDEPVLINVGGVNKFAGRLAANQNRIVTQITDKAINQSEVVEPTDVVQ